MDNKDFIAEILGEIPGGKAGLKKMHGILVNKQINWRFIAAFTEDGNRLLIIEEECINTDEAKEIIRFDLGKPKIKLHKKGIVEQVRTALLK